MSKHTTKAVRATIHLGMIPLEVFQLPNGEYCLSQTQVAQAVGKPDNAVREFLGSKAPEAAPYKTLPSEKISIADTGRTFIRVPIELAAAYWLKETLKGNTSAALMLGACAVEAIERRADAAFGIRRDEAERNERLKARIQGKVVRRSFTDAIADYLDRHSELSEDSREWMYVNSSEAVNRVVFNKRAWELRNERGADRHSLRDTFSAQELLLVQEVEDVAQRLVDYDDEHPPTAVRLAGERLLIGSRAHGSEQKRKPVRQLTRAGNRR